MEELTLIIALVASGLVLATAPIYGLIIYIAALGWYPSYMTVKIGTIDFSVCRIIMIPLLLNALLKITDKPQWNWLDKMMGIFFTAQLVAGVTTTELAELAENRAGAAFDFILPYFAMRLIVRDHVTYSKLLKALVMIMAPLAIVGFYQCVTGNNPVGFLKKYYAWREMQGYVAIPRHGFYRADLTFPMSIMFGLFFSMFGPLVAGLKTQRSTKMIAYIGIALMLLGVFDSMSSGPMLAALLAMMFMFIYRFRKYWRGMVGVAAVGCLIVEIISNRHFYDVLGSFTLSPGTAWYRSKLIDVALFQGGMTGYWITGHGFADPGWSLLIDNRDHTDIVNQYLLFLSVYGLVGLIPFFGVIYYTIKYLVEAFKKSINEYQRWIVWGLAASVFGTLGAMTSVSLFGQPLTIFFSILGICGSMPELIQKSCQVPTMPKQAYTRIGKHINAHSFASGRN
jgi:hypothetical protein